MGYVTAQELHTYINNNPLTAAEALGHMNHTIRDTLVDAKNTGSWGFEYVLKPSLTLDDCQQALDAMHISICEGQFNEWKALRPWNIVDIASTLDPDKPWIGWEIETGWGYDGSRTAVLSKFFDQYNHVCVDNEGPAYGAEMTWSPAVDGEFEGEHPLHFVVRMANEHRAYRHDSEDEVGTHINVSVPLARKDEDMCRTLGYMLNAQIMDMPHDVRERLVGRSYIYGGFFVREGGGNYWLEGKLFNSTYSTAEADQYIKTAAGVAKVMELGSKFVKENLVAPGYLQLVNTLEEVVDGAEPVFAVRIHRHVVGGDDIQTYDEPEYDDYYDDEEEDY